MSSARRPVRGFSLVELMAVVVMVAVLSLVGVAIFRRQVVSSRTREATSYIEAIAAAEVAFKAKNLTYLSVSGSIETFYPTSAPDSKIYAWDYPGGPDYANWARLGVVDLGPTHFGFAVVAGPAGAVPPTPVLNSPPTWTTTTSDWYLIQAIGDTDGDGHQIRVLTSSFRNDVYMEGED